MGTGFLEGPVAIRQGVMEIQTRSKDEILYCEGGEALAQGAQRSCGCPLPGSVQGQVGWGFVHPGLVEGFPVNDRRVGTG